RKIEIGANDRAVYQQSISCFIVYANFDWFLINWTHMGTHTALNNKKHQSPHRGYVNNLI
ncbi:MAG: hypothetical protein KHY88_10985, partial [Erysipelotrichaceae bacterium]|nr:hypothetical protein [Erysipelotrichaceae bacterium]